MLIQECQVILQDLILLALRSILPLDAGHALLQILPVDNHCALQVLSFDAGEVEVHFYLAVANYVHNLNRAKLPPRPQSKSSNGLATAKTTDHPTLTCSSPLITSSEMPLPRHLHEHFQKLLVSKLLPEPELRWGVISNAPKLKFLLKHSLLNG